MDVRIIVETVFENGEARTREVGHISRSLDPAGPESLGLRLEEAKCLVKRLPEVVLRDQIDEALEATGIAVLAESGARSMTTGAAFSTRFMVGFA